MARASAKEIYEQYVRLLPVAERLQLLALVADDLGLDLPTIDAAHQRGFSIVDLHGLGRQIWEGIEPQDYVNKLRDEWGRANSDEA